MDKNERTKPGFLEEENKWRALFAEMWGTFILVFAGAGIAMAAAYTGEISKAMEMAVPGIAVMVIIYFLGAVSGAHINPVVTIAFAIRHHFPWKKVPAYIIAQLLGSILAMVLLKGLFGDIKDLGATIPHHGFPDAKTFLLEMLITMGLVNTILGTASGPGNLGKNDGIAVGGYIVLATFFAGPLTGASMNLARTLAPDIVRGDFSKTWIYILAILSGAFVAIVFEWILKGKPSEHADSEAQGEESDDKD